MLIPYLCCYHYAQKSSSKAWPPLPLLVHHLEQTPSLFALLFHPHFTALLPCPSGFTLVRSCSHSHLALPITFQVSSPTSSPHQEQQEPPQLSLAHMLQSQCFISSPEVPLAEIIQLALQNKMILYVHPSPPSKRSCPPLHFHSNRHVAQGCF